MRIMDELKKQYEAMLQRYSRSEKINAAQLVGLMGLIIKELIKLQPNDKR
jgi:hypothetical protein